MDKQELIDLYAAGARDFSGIHLDGVNLRGIDLSRADLSKANLSRADLSGATLYRVDLYEADLSGANLRGAAVTVEQLAEARSLDGAILPDGTVARRNRRMRRQMKRRWN
jgi:uncharacterized protein YjbI with pentapeptide repeats